MPDEAVITIRFKDESSPGGSGVATTSPVGGGSNPGSVTTADQQSAITQAGGVGAWAAKNSTASQGGTTGPTFAPMPPAQALPMPPVGALGAIGGDPLLKTAAGIVQADPSVTVAELQKALGIQAARAQQLLNAATVQPGGVSGVPAPTAALPMPPATGLPVPPASPSSPPPAPGPQPPTFIQPPPVVGSPESRVTPPPVINPPVNATAVDTSQGVQSAVNAIAGLAARGGPIGAAAGQAASAAVAIPGVASSLGALATAAPLIAATGAALAVPATGMLVLNSIAQTARGQVQGLSPEVAAAEAEASIRRLMANLRTSQILGDEVASNIRQNSRIASAAQGLRDVAVEPLLQDMNANMSILAKAMEQANKFAQKNPALVGESVKSVAVGILDGLFPGWKLGTSFEILAKLDRWLNKQDSNSAVGIAAIIPKRPKLPPPFLNDAPEAFSRTPMVRDGTPGLSL